MQDLFEFWEDLIHVFLGFLALNQQKTLVVIKFSITQSAISVLKLSLKTSSFSSSVESLLQKLSMSSSLKKKYVTWHVNLTASKTSNVKFVIFLPDFQLYILLSNQYRHYFHLERYFLQSFFYAPYKKFPRIQRSRDITEKMDKNKPNL